MGSSESDPPPEVGFDDWWYGRGGGIVGLIVAVTGGLGLGAVLGVFIGIALQTLPPVPQEQVVISVTAAVMAAAGGTEAVRTWRIARRHGSSEDPWDEHHWRERV